MINRSKRPWTVFCWWITCYESLPTETPEVMCLLAGSSPACVSLCVCCVRVAAAMSPFWLPRLTGLCSSRQLSVCEEADLLQLCSASASHLRVIHFLHIMTSLSLSLHVSMCSLFTAHPFSFVSSSLLPSLSFGLRCSDGSGLSTCDGGVCVCEAHRNVASGYSSRMNETPPPPALVCLECVCEKRWRRRNEELSRDLDSPDRETKRWRDKIEWPRQREKEGGRQRERERARESHKHLM